MSKNPETIIEEYLTKKVKSLGGQSYKWQPPRGLDGVPDRIIMYNNKTFFVEVKTKDGTLRPSQKNLFPVISQVHDLHVVYGKDGVDQFINEELLKWQIKNLKTYEKISIALSALVKVLSSAQTKLEAEKLVMSVQHADIVLHQHCTPSLKFYPPSKQKQLRVRKDSL